MSLMPLHLTEGHIRELWGFSVLEENVNIIK